MVAPSKVVHKRAPQPAKPTPVAAASAPALIEVRRSRVQGRGVFAAIALKRGQRLGEYTGALVTDEEAGERYDDEQMDRHHTFLFSIGTGLSIDGRDGGNATRFINHSCAPNCESRQRGKRIFIYALRAVSAGEELFYDYSYELEGTVTRKTLAHYKCLCGAASCRGTILNLSAAQRRKLLTKTPSTRKPVRKAAKQAKPS